MRPWIVFFSIAVCLTARGEPLPEIKLGSDGRAIEISMTPWYPGHLSSSAAFLAGKVIEVDSAVQTTPQQTWLSESCVIQVERAFGDLKPLTGISKAKLTAGYEHSPYLPVEPQWGRLRHLKKNQRILVLLHEYEGGPSFGSEALIEIAYGIEDLPRILRRTAFDPARFTDADLAVLKLASPLLYDEVIAIAEIRLEVRQDEATWLNRLVLGIVAGFLVLLLVVQRMAQKPIT